MGATNTQSCGNSQDAFKGILYFGAGVHMRAEGAEGKSRYMYIPKKMGIGGRLFCRKKQTGHDNNTNNTVGFGRTTLYRKLPRTQRKTGVVSSASCSHTRRLHQPAVDLGHDKSLRLRSPLVAAVVERIRAAREGRTNPTTTTKSRQVCTTTEGRLGAENDA